MVRGLVILSLLFLAACQTPAERAAALEVEMEKTITIYGPSCEKLGFEKETDGWRECILRLKTQEEARYRNNRPSFSGCYGNVGFWGCTHF